MRTQQPKEYEAWRCRREQYLRESGRHVELIKEGYESADSATEWTVVVGGRGCGHLEPGPGERLFLVKGQVSTFVLGAKREVDWQPEESAPQKRGRRGGR
jgi:hypothetical protein